ncbi:unnamed protein product [Gordionus sp. m RMFG-2023]|uniref:uncharacterized protein LOC135929983 n=1 Tax=Gordionus sp. m RMFG-2023 TaxID=3053472 RepID=UPI0030E3F993
MLPKYNPDYDEFIWWNYSKINILESKFYEEQAKKNLSHKIRSTEKPSSSPKLKSKIEENHSKFEIPKEKYETQSQISSKDRSLSPLSKINNLKNKEKALSKEIDDCLNLVEKTLKEGPKFINSRTDNVLIERIEMLEKDNQETKQTIKNLYGAIIDLTKKIQHLVH